MINAATNRVTGTIAVGQMPWQLALSPRATPCTWPTPIRPGLGDQHQLCHGDRTISLAGDPDTLALTPDGSQLWVGGLTSAIVTLLDTATASVAGNVNLGDDGANSGDGYEPTGIVLTATPTPGGS